MVAADGCDACYPSRAISSSSSLLSCTAYVTIFGRLARWVCTYYSIGWTDWIPAYSSKSFSRFWAIANWWGLKRTLDPEWLRPLKLSPFW